MKLRTKTYLRRKKAIQRMAAFTDLKSFLKASFELSQSLVVKKDLLNTLFSLEHRNTQVQMAS
jgi:hypothetical protein